MGEGQAGLEGEVTGAAAYMGSAGGSIFRATTWTDRLFGEPHTDAGGTFYTGGLFQNAPLPLEHYAGEFARRFRCACACPGQSGRCFRNSQ